MTTRYRLSLEFDGPEPSQTFSPLLFQKEIERFILDRLNLQEELRRQALEKLYNLKAIKIEYISTDV